MTGIGGLFGAGLPAAAVAITTILMVAAMAVAGEEISVAAFPEEVGISGERLRAIDAVMQRHVDSGKFKARSPRWHGAAR